MFEVEAGGMTIEFGAYWAESVVVPNSSFAGAGNRVSSTSKPQLHSDLQQGGLQEESGPRKPIQEKITESQMASITIFGWLVRLLVRGFRPQEQPAPASTKISPRSKVDRTILRSTARVPNRATSFQEKTNKQQADLKQYSKNSSTRVH